MTRRRPSTLHGDESGAVMAEAALVMIPLVFFLMIAPAIALIWASEQHARTEAHRDMLDKTTCLVQIPKGNKTTSGTLITEAQRRRAYPAIPPKIDALAGNPNGIIDPPDPWTIGAGPMTATLFSDGFPNYYAEGWQYRKFRYAGGWWQGDMELMRYGAVARTPWTWLGWPFVPTQDFYLEPKQIQGWYDDQKVDDKLKKRLKLID